MCFSKKKEFLNKIDEQYFIPQVPCQMNMAPKPRVKVEDPTKVNVAGEASGAK